MSLTKKYLKIYLFLNLIVFSLSKVNNDGLKINTDLMAGIISHSVNSASVNSNNKNSIDSLNISQNSSNTNLMLSNTSLEDNHICTKEEEYVEQIRTPSMQPVKIRTATWCLEFPPRCSNYKTEMREMVKVQNITKTRTIRFCCSGYEGNISINDTVCKPVCRGGCGRGYCLKPDECSCEPGYMGKHCTQRCDHDHWGLECKNLCQCHNGAACDNKSGICHCTIGWTGEFCEQPCPMGTHGVMCRKACECDNKLCHPQTGACDKPIDPSVAPNATHVMIATLNSTIVNITHNLDRIAKNIVNIATTTEGINLVLPPQILELTTAKTIPEVIVIKQDEPSHAPKIIVHQQGQGILENLHTGAKAPEVIHVITNWPAETQPHQNNTNQDEKINLAGFGGNNDESSKSSENHNSGHENSLLTTLLVILLIIMVAIGIGFLYVYRRYHLQKAQVEATLAARNVSLVPSLSPPTVITPPPIPPHTSEQHLKEIGGSGLVAGSGTVNKSFLKPLPDLPAFTQMVRNKIEGPDLYDSPSNTSSITSQTPTPTPYAYARKESLYSVVTPKSRKGSMDSHLYDEIRYPTALHQQSHINSHNIYPYHGHHSQQQQQQKQQQQHQQQHHLYQHQHLQHQQHHSHHQQSHAHHQSTPSSASHHVSHLIIPPQNSKYLQVPQMSHTSHKVAHF